MIIRFDDDVTAHPPSFRWLTRLVYLVEDGRHAWVVSDAVKIMESPWYQGLGRDKEPFGELLMRSQGRSLNHGRLSSMLITENGEGESKTAEAAYHYLKEPFKMVVENVESDGTFLELILTRLAKHDLHKLLKNKYLRLEQSGGKGEVVKTVKRILASEGRLSVLVDGDGLLPGEKDEKSAKILEYCEKQGVPCHVTEKREIENYLLPKALSEWAKKKTQYLAAAQSFENLSQEQRDFFDMKKGFRKQDERQNSLFEGVEALDRANLASGFGDNVYKAFEKTSVSAKDLKRLARREFEQILSHIYSKI